METLLSNLCPTDVPRKDSYLEYSRRIVTPEDIPFIEVNGILHIDLDILGALIVQAKCQLAVAEGNTRISCCYGVIGNYHVYFTPHNSPYSNDHWQKAIKVTQRNGVKNFQDFWQMCLNGKFIGKSNEDYLEELFR